MTSAGGLTDPNLFTISQRTECVTSGLPSYMIVLAPIPIMLTATFFVRVRSILFTEEGRERAHIPHHPPGRRELETNVVHALGFVPKGQRIPR